MATTTASVPQSTAKPVSLFKSKINYFFAIDFKKKELLAGQISTIHLSRAQTALMLKDLSGAISHSTKALKYAKCTPNCHEYFKKAAQILKIRASAYMQKGENSTNMAIMYPKQDMPPHKVPITSPDFVPSESAMSYAYLLIPNDFFAETSIENLKNSVQDYKKLGNIYSTEFMNIMEAHDAYMSALEALGKIIEITKMPEEKAQAEIEIKNLSMLAEKCISGRFC